MEEFLYQLHGDTFQEAVTLTQEIITDVTRVERISYMRYRNNPSIHNLRLWEKFRNRILDYKNLKNYLYTFDLKDKVDSGSIAAYERRNN